MKLYGSTSSPYARRLRILMVEIQHDFVNINIFGEDRALLKAKNPTLKIPMLEDHDNLECPIIFDSGVIFQYLINKFNLPALSIKQQTQLAMIDACTDSLLNILFLSRSGVDTSQDSLYFNSQRERSSESFNQLDCLVAENQFLDWSYVSISLYCLIEWAQFRQLFDFTNYRNLCAFTELNRDQPGIKTTIPNDQPSE